MPTPANSINEATTGICGFTGTGFTATPVTAHDILIGGATSSTIAQAAPSATSGVPLISQGASADPAFGTAVVAGGGTGRITLTNHGVLVGAGTTAITQLAAGSAGQVLQSGGASADPVYSTATYPSTAGTAGKVLISDGTNIVSSTPTFPNASATAGKFIQSDGTNWVASTPTLPTSAGTSGKVLQSNGTNYVESTPTYPSTSGAAGKVIISDGTNNVYSTPTFPNSATSTGTILRADGTNWVATTATYPATTTANQILYSSATNTISEITAAANSILLTNGSNVPSLGTSLANDFTFTSSTAGTVRTLTVTNTDNTNAASGALIKAVSGGASAGDGVFQASTTTTVWSFGVDNSVTSPTADPFVIAQGTALGTNNIMSVATSGEINYPLQSAFLATASGQTDVTGDGTTYTVIFANEIFDQNSDFDGTSTFTAPVTGRYVFSAGIAVDDLTASHTAGSWPITTSNRSYRIGSCNWGANRTASTNVNASFATYLCDMDAADTAIVQVVVSNGTKVVDIDSASKFSGYLAC